MSTRMNIGNQPIVLDNLTHSYDFSDYTSGTTLTNLVSASHSASLDNSPTHNKLGYLELDGSNDSITLSNDLGISAGNPVMTLEMGFRIDSGAPSETWLMPTADGVPPSIETNSVWGGPYHKFSFARDTDKKLMFQAWVLGGNGNSKHTGPSTSTIEDNVWYHMSVKLDTPVTNDPFLLDVKINDVQYLENTNMRGNGSGPHYFYGADSSLILGANAPSNQGSRTTYPVEIAYFRRYSVALSDAQRTQNYNHHAGRFGGQRY